MLRKIQIVLKIVAQNTEYFVTQSTNYFKNCYAKYSKDLLPLCCAKYRCCANYNKPSYTHSLGKCTNEIILIFYLFFNLLPYTLRG